MKNSTLILASTVLFFSACKLDKPIFPKVTSSTTTGTGTSGTGTTGTGTGTGGTGPNTLGYYFKGTLGNQMLDWEVTDDSNGWVVGSSSATTNDQGLITGGITALISASSGYQPQLGIEFHTYQINYDQDKSAYFNSFITTGAWAFATDSSFPVNKKLLVIDYTDSKGNSYSSIGDQTGSSSNIISVTQVSANSAVSLDESLKIKLTFTCTLYPTDGSSGTIKISNAETTISLENML